ncbi:hypothetical protein HBZS_114080 [Helicobacter bizzozeronii CCUG 35545]|nr:hypothetical protein HBZS_114080 [Helicobacter bizzozeronii CCUG 35545]
MRKFLCMLAPITTCSAQWFGSLGLTIGAQIWHGKVFTTDC